MDICWSSNKLYWQLQPKILLAIQHLTTYTWFFQVEFCSSVLQVHFVVGCTSRYNVWEYRDPCKNSQILRYKTLDRCQFSASWSVSRFAFQSRSSTVWTWQMIHFFVSKWRSKPFLNNHQWRLTYIFHHHERVLGKDPTSQNVHNPTCLLFDELHCWILPDIASQRRNVHRSLTFQLVDLLWGFSISASLKVTSLLILNFLFSGHHNLYPFTPSGYLRKMHFSALASSFPSLIWAYAGQPNILIYHNWQENLTTSLLEF